MRQLTQVADHETARLLGDVLLAEGIENDVNAARDGGFVVWVHDEAQLAAAQTLRDEVVRDPGNARFADARRRAEAQRQAAAQVPPRARVIPVARRWVPAVGGLGRLTAVLIGACVLVALVTSLGHKDEVVRQLTFASYQRSGSYVQWHGLADLLGGQVYRLITPIFLHFGMIHLFFNMWWLKDLGTLIERRHSALYLGAVVLAVGVVSNTAQYLWGGPVFGGMSGVVYGLLGYLWLRGRLDPGFAIALPRTEVIWMLGWLVLCYTGLMGPIANAAHTVGLVSGGLWGVLTSGYLWRRRR